MASSLPSLLVENSQPRQSVTFFDTFVMGYMTRFAVFFCTIFLYQLRAQDPTSILVQKIKASDRIECAHLGYAGNPSVIFRIADTLNSLVSMNETLTLLKDSNFVLQYYAFRGLLYKNDSIAFQILCDKLTDSTDIIYYCSCKIETMKFNELLVWEYRRFIEYKYRDGGSGVMGDDYNVYQFPKADTRRFKRLKKELETWIMDSEVPSLKSGYK